MMESEFFLLLYIIPTAFLFVIFFFIFINPRNRDEFNKIGDNYLLKIMAVIFCLICPLLNLLIVMKILYKVLYKDASPTNNSTQKDSSTT